MNATPRTSHRRMPALTRSALVAAAACAAGGLAQAETSPYYLGVGESLLRDTNIFRLGNDQALPSTLNGRSDTILATSLVAGLDQPIGRQRLYGTATVRNNRYQTNSLYNYTGALLNTGLDWSTADRVSGNLSYSLNRAARKYDASAGTTLDARANIETDQSFRASARVGVVTRLTAEATLDHTRVGFSEESYRPNQNRGTTWGLGMGYRVGGFTTVGLNYRSNQTRFDAPTSDYNRSDVDVNVNWVPSGLTSVYGRISRTSLRHNIASSTDFSGSTWELRGSTQASGKVRLSTSVWHDTGLSSSSFNVQTLSGNTALGTAQFNRSTTAVKLMGEYQLSAKNSFNLSLTQARRDLSNGLTTLVAGDGSDSTLTWALGWDWAPYRFLTLGCDLGTERRSVSSNLSLPYKSTSLGCNLQVTMR